jgi:hypothetical protein
MTTVAKMEDGRIVEIVRVAARVAFSDAVGWVCVCFDFGVCERRKQQFKWVPASTRFEWVRDFVS